MRDLSSPRDGVWRGFRAFASLLQALCIPLASLLAVAVLAVGCTQTAPGLDRSGAAPPAPLAYAAPGTRIALLSTVDGQIERTEITADVPEGPRGGYIGADGRSGGFYPGCWGCGGLARIDEAAYLDLWPLETGKRVTFLRENPDGTQHRVVIRVAGTERIETAAGPFDTYLLDGRIETVTGGRFSAQVRAWWAPDPGWVVRAEGGSGSGSVLTSEVVAITPP